MKFKKIKKIAALTCVATTLIPANIVSAATLSGDSTIENSSASTPQYTSVVLPTSNAGIYDFTIDRAGLLKEHGDAADFGTANGVLFSAVTTPASMAVKESTNAFYVKDKVDLSSATNTTLTTALADGLAELASKEYYVWQPDTSSETANSVEPVNGLDLQLTMPKISLLLHMILMV